MVASELLGTRPSTRSIGALAAVRGRHASRILSCMAPPVGHFVSDAWAASMRRQSIVRTGPPPVTTPADFFTGTTICSGIGYGELGHIASRPSPRSHLPRSSALLHDHRGAIT